MLAWEQRKLSEIVILYGGNAFKSSDSKKEGTRWLKIANIGFNRIDWSTSSYLPKEYWEKYEEYQLKKNDYVMALTRPILNGTLKISKIDQESLLNQRIAKLDFTTDYEFGFQLLKMSRTVSLIENELAGTDPPNLSSKNLDNINIEITSSNEEQTKIGTFFKQLDKTIALHERELELLNLTKKGFLQQLFTNNSQLFPNIRFSDFQEEWKQHRLENVAKFSKGKGYTKNDLVQYGFKIILYGRMYTKYETIIESIDTYVENNDDCIFSFKDDVIMPSSGESSLDIVRASVVPYAGIILGGDINIIELDKKIMNPIFIALSISNGTLKKEISNLAQGNSVVHLYNSELKKVNVQSPVIQEQEIISNFFKQLDKIITLREKELENLKNVKSAFLQKIFV
ncbi:restriction endonuclease subunit S [Vagococcus fluvialis]|uniref:restriction endonuclease subunit S n=1 Tax=Vagococcus fluvialis TaxID=2738 RepID=UPI002B2F1251|nr:restriction endonuclease subunit S [Vagococcus fluvialis]